MKNILSRVKKHPFLTILALVIVVGLVKVTLKSSDQYGVDKALTSSPAMGLVAPDSIGGAPGLAMEREAFDESMISPPFSPTAGETAAEVDQRIIKTASMRVEVNDVAESVKALVDYASTAGGFIERSSVLEKTDGTKSGTIVLRVPVKSFEDALERVRSEAEVVRQETIEGQDVTEQYTDLQAQLRNTRAQETAYLDILAQARSVEDILKVQVQLGQIRGQIERLEGRIKYLENLTGFSTIRVSLEEEAVVRVGGKEFRPVSAAKEAVTMLVQTFQSFVISAIWFAIVGLGVALPIAAVIWLLWKAVKMLRRK